VVLPSPPAADQLFGRAPSATAAPGTATTAAQTIASQLGPAAIPSTAETEKTTPAFLSAQASDREAWARASEVLLGPNRGGGLSRAQRQSLAAVADSVPPIGSVLAASMAPSASLVAAYAALTPSWHSEAPGSPPIKSLPSSALPRRSLASPQPPKHISAGFSPELSASGVEDEAVAVQIPSDLGVCVAARLPEARRPDEAFVNATRNKKSAKGAARPQCGPCECAQVNQR